MRHYSKEAIEEHVRLGLRRKWELKWEQTRLTREHRLSSHSDFGPESYCHANEMRIVIAGAGASAIVVDGVDVLKSPERGEWVECALAGELESHDVVADCAGHLDLDPPLRLLHHSRSHLHSDVNLNGRQHHPLRRAMLDVIVNGLYRDHGLARVRGATMMGHCWTLGGSLVCFPWRISVRDSRASEVICSNPRPGLFLTSLVDHSRLIVELFTMHLH